MNKEYYKRVIKFKLIRLKSNLELLDKNIHDAKVAIGCAELNRKSIVAEIEGIENYLEDMEEDNNAI